MNIKLIKPHDKTKDTDVFLAGPIQGVGDWQEKFYDKLCQNLSVIKTEDQPNVREVIVADPRAESMEGFIFKKQVAWETENLAKASVIVFWLAKETEHDCSRAYAQTTRFEMGEWLAKMQYAPEYKNKHIVIGYEEGFTGMQYVRTRLEQDIKGNFVLCKSLEACVEVCASLVCNMWWLAESK